MFQIFTWLADWATAKIGLCAQTPLGSAVHFFIEDVTKIFVLIYVLIFVISLFRAQLSPEKARDYLAGKNRWYGYFLAVFLGIVTPFCSCSSIPLFIGFITAGIPFGITMAFLISSPLVSEIATFMLISMQGAGLGVALVYVASGTVIAVIGGWRTVCIWKNYASTSPLHTPPLRVRADTKRSLSARRIWCVMHILLRGTRLKACGSALFWGFWWGPPYTASCR